MFVRTIRFVLGIFAVGIIVSNMPAYDVSSNRVFAEDAPARSNVPDETPAPTGIADVTPSRAYSDQVFAESDLMIGGKRIVDPLRKDTLYYLAPSHLLWQGPGNPVNYGKQSGLFLSKDNGRTWQVLSRSFDFTVFFVHPITGEFFAIIDYQWLKADETGFLQHYFSNKIIRSTDGKNWVDITPTPGHASDLISIMQDPEHPKRICLEACMIRLVFLQYTDDSYTNWKGISGSQWMKEHPDALPPTPK